MEGGLLYHLKVLHYVTTTTNYITFGVTLPDGTQLRPIPEKYLWIELPGNTIHFLLRVNNIKVK
jgi:hypothetical protein